MFEVTTYEDRVRFITKLGFNRAGTPISTH